MFKSAYKATLKFFPALFAFASIMWFAHGALAQSSVIPEYTHQPAAGVSEVGAHVGYRSATFRGTANAASTTLSGLDRLGVSYMYGLSDMFALGADVAYSTYGGTNNNSGIEPIEIVGQGMYPLSSGAFIYGAEVLFGLEKARLDANGDRNRSFGDPAVGFGRSGLKVGPYIGYAMPLGDSTIGARLRYNVVDLDSTVTTPLGDLTIGSENAGRAALFYEYRITDMPLGAALIYDWFKSPSLTGPGAVAFGGLGARSLIGLQLYTAMNYGGFAFKPSLEWREKASGDYDKLSDLTLTLAARMGF